jgi:hypothetical protein
MYSTVLIDIYYFINTLLRCAITKEKVDFGYDLCCDFSTRISSRKFSAKPPSPAEA